MSAFILKTEVINKLADTMASRAQWGTNETWQTKSACIALFQSLPGARFSSQWGFNSAEQQNSATRALAEAMHNLNRQAVCSRYGDCEGFETYDGYSSAGYFRTQFDLLKALHCLIYQCSEGNCPEADLFKSLETVAAAIEHDLIIKMPEYEKAQWG